MTALPTRRVFGAVAIGAVLSRGLPARARARAAALAWARDALAALEARCGGRLGVAALDRGSGRRIAYRDGERFPMASTHKFLSAAAVLKAVDTGRMTLDRHVPYGSADLTAYAPDLLPNFPPVIS